MYCTFSFSLSFCRRHQCLKQRCCCLAADVGDAAVHCCHQDSIQFNVLPSQCRRRRLTVRLPLPTTLCAHQPPPPAAAGSMKPVPHPLLSPLISSALVDTFSTDSVITLAGQGGERESSVRRWQLSSVLHLLLSSFFFLFFPFLFVHYFPSPLPSPCSLLSSINRMCHIN